MVDIFQFPDYRGLAEHIPTDSERAVALSAWLGQGWLLGKIPRRQAAPDRGGGKGGRAEIAGAKQLTLMLSAFRSRDAQREKVGGREKVEGGKRWSEGQLQRGQGTLQDTRVRGKGGHEG